MRVDNMDFIVTPKEFAAAIRKAGQNPRGPTRASVEAVIRKYREAYVKNCHGNDKSIYQGNVSRLQGEEMKTLVISSIT